MSHVEFSIDGFSFKGDVKDFLYLKALNVFKGIYHGSEIPGNVEGLDSNVGEQEFPDKGADNKSGNSLRESSNNNKPTEERVFAESWDDFSTGSMWKSKVSGQEIFIQYANSGYVEYRNMEKVSVLHSVKKDPSLPWFQIFYKIPSEGKK